MKKVIYAFKLLDKESQAHSQSIGNEIELYTLKGHVTVLQLF